MTDAEGATAPLSAAALEEMDDFHDCEWKELYAEEVADVARLEAEVTGLRAALEGIPSPRAFDTSATVLSKLYYCVFCGGTGGHDVEHTDKCPWLIARAALGDAPQPAPAPSEPARQ